MDSISVSLNSGNNDGSVVILELFGLGYGFSSSGYSLLVHRSAVFDLEGNVMAAVTVLLEVSGELGIPRVKRISESVHNISVLDDMSAEISDSGLEALVGVETETHSRGIEGCGLLGIGNVEGGMVESDKLSNIRLKVSPRYSLLFQWAFRAPYEESVKYY